MPFKAKRPPEKMWTIKSKEAHIALARAKFGEAFDWAAGLEPKLKDLELKAMAIWDRLIEEKPSFFRDTEDWYGENGLKHQMSRLVGWFVTTPAGPPPSRPENHGVLSAGDLLTPEYEKWAASNRLAHRAMGPVGSQEAYNAAYNYLFALIPYDYNWTESDQHLSEGECEDWD